MRNVGAKNTGGIAHACSSGFVCLDNVVDSEILFFDPVVRLLVVYPDCAPCDSVHLLCCEGLVVIQKPFGTLWLSESQPSVLELVKTEETIESLSQTGELYSDLPSCAENQRAQSERSMLEEVAAKAAAMAEAQTQPEDLPTVEDSMEVETARLAGHSVKKRMAVATSEDGGPKGPTILVDDFENTAFEGLVGRTHGSNAADRTTPEY